MTFKLCCRPQLRKDKGYAWVVMIMSCLSQFAHLGFTFGVVGNLTIAHQEFFGINLQTSSLIGSVHIGVVMLFGPLTTVLIKRFGCRMTQLFGGTCILLGIGLSFLSTQFWQAILLFGVLAGVGISSCYAAGSQILALHFHKYKYLAFSASRLGNFLGVMTWPILSEYLINRLGYSKAMLILSSAHVIHIIAGVCFLEPQSKEVEDINGRGRDDLQESTKTGDKHSLEKGVQNEGFHIPEDDLSDNESRKGSNSLSLASEDIGRSSISSLKTEFITIFKLPKIWLLIANAVCWSVNSSGFLILASDYAVGKIGINTEEAALGITILGVASIAGCLTVIITSPLMFDRLILHFCAAILFGVASIGTSFSTTKVVYYCLTVVWGLGQGSLITNLLAIACDFCGVHQLPLVFGIQMMAQGVGNLTLIPLAAYIARKTGAEYGMIFIGTSGIVASLFILPVIINKLRENRKLQINESSISPCDSEQSISTVSKHSAE